MDVSLWVWVGVIAVILAMLAVDLVSHRDAHVIKVREAAAWSAVWVALGGVVQEVGDVRAHLIPPVVCRPAVGPNLAHPSAVLGTLRL